MAYDTIAFRMKDAESDTRLQTVPVYVPSGQSIATLQAIVDAFAPLLDAVTDAQIAEVEVTTTLTVPAGVKGSPVAASLNERGGLILFDTDGPRRESVRIPAIKRSIMSGDSFSLADASVGPLVTWLTTDQTINSQTVRIVSPYEYELTAAVRGAKSLRRK